MDVSSDTRLLADRPSVVGRNRTRVLIAVVAALACHAILLMLVTALMRPGSVEAPVAHSYELAPRGIVWVPAQGRGGGGGGGGDRTRAPVRRVTLPGRDRITVPVAAPLLVHPQIQTPTHDVPPRVVIEAIPLAAGRAAFAGLIEIASAMPTLSQGPGDRGGAGTGDGDGIGDGRGSGLGLGQSSGTGDGVYEVGNGVSAPVAILIEKPLYTVGALHARIHGSVIVECIVEPDGVCRNVRIVRSLDQAFGLDREAIRAAERWRFEPGMRLGKSVPVLVRIELEFAIR